MSLELSTQLHTLVKLPVMPAIRPSAATATNWLEKHREEDKRLAMLSMEERLASWTAAVNELYRVQGFDDLRVAARHCKAKERKLLAYFETHLPGHLSNSQ